MMKTEFNIWCLDNAIADIRERLSELTPDDLAGIERAIVDLQWIARNARTKEPRAA